MLRLNRHKIYYLRLNIFNNKGLEKDNAFRALFYQSKTTSLVDPAIIGADCIFIEAWKKFIRYIKK
jgi:hypothetical protein